MISAPWEWQPSLDAWFGGVANRARGWSPDQTLGLETERLIAACVEAAESQAPWLWHPCASRLTANGDGATVQRDLQLALWIAAHTRADLGSVLVPEGTCVWLADEGRAISAGQYSLHEIAYSLTPPGPRARPALDVWCDSVGSPEPFTWAAEPPTEAADEDCLRQQMTRYWRSVAFLEQEFPRCHGWVAGTTRVAIPLRGEGDTFRSCSHPGLPGAVELDLIAEVQILEALVHESAHLYLFRAETASPLIDPAHSGLYRSPLRPEPRPLRGILLAYHALAYIAAFYRETLDHPVVAKWGNSELSARIDLAREAEDVLHDHARDLEPAGRDFLDRTGDVLAYSIA